MTDDDLRALLAAADPARLLPDPDPATLEDLMTRTTSELDITPVPPARPPRSRWVVAAASVAGVAAAGAVAWAALGGAPSAGPGTPEVPAVAATYSVPQADITAICVPVSADLLSSTARAAFSGRVVGVDGDLVVLEVTRWYRGGDGAERVAVRAPEPDLTALLGAPELEKGSTYLLTVDAQGEVGTCGTSGPDEPVLRGLYEQAFGG